MFKSLLRWFNGVSGEPQIKVHNRHFRPRLEILEDRSAPTAFSVESLADIFNPPADFDTLGSAIDASRSGNSIDLTIAADYALSRTPGEFDNSTGEFAIFSSGDNHRDRVFAINPIFIIGGAIVTDHTDVTAEFDHHRGPSKPDDER